MNPPFPVDRSGPDPIYQQIVAWIRDQIAVGAWPPRFKLKAEVDLAAELAVSRGTVRKAIAELMAEGLLIQTHGRGTFVAPHVVEQPLADRFVTFSEDLISKGVPFETRLLDHVVLAARGHVATLLRVNPGAKVFYLRRVRLVDEEPLILLHNYVVYERCPGIETVDFAVERLFQALEERYGLRLVAGHRTFQARARTARSHTCSAWRRGIPSCTSSSRPSWMTARSSSARTSGSAAIASGSAPTSAVRARAIWVSRWRCARCWRPARSRRIGPIGRS